MKQLPVLGIVNLSMNVNAYDCTQRLYEKTSGVNNVCSNSRFVHRPRAFCHCFRKQQGHMFRLHHSITVGLNSSRACLRRCVCTRAVIGYSSSVSQRAARVQCLFNFSHHLRRQGCSSVGGSPGSGSEEGSFYQLSVQTVLQRS